MGADYYAYVVLGVIVDSSKYERKVKAFQHDHPENWKVDPVSGKELWRIEGGRNVLEEMDFGVGPAISVIELGYDTNRAAVGLELCTCQGEDGDLSGLSSLSPKGVQQASVPLKERLKKVGFVFGDSEFGIHVVMHVSV